MSNLYLYFGKDYLDILDFSDEALIELFNSESYGTPCKNSNGFLVGKKWLNVTVSMWKEDIKLGTLMIFELYEDPNLPHWFLDSIFKKINF